MQSEGVGRIWVDSRSKVFDVDLILPWRSATFTAACQYIDGNSHKRDELPGSVRQHGGPQDLPVVVDVNFYEGLLGLQQSVRECEESSFHLLVCQAAVEHALGH